MSYLENNALKIAIIEPVGGHGGMHYYDFNLADKLVNAGAKVILYTCDKTIAPKGLTFDVKHTFKKIWGDDYKLFRAFRFFVCMINTILDAKRQNLEIVHYHFFHYTLMELYCVLLAKFFHLKIIITAHDIRSFAGGHSDITIRYVISIADKLIAHNNLIQRELIEKIKVSKELIEIIPHGNYLNIIQPTPSREDARKILNLSTEGPVILFFGQIKEVKGLDILLSALPSVVKKYPNIKLLIAGKVWKDDFTRYEKLIKINHLQHNIKLYIRYIPDDEVATYYRSSDLVVLPYRRIYQSGVLLMAMSYGVPVVVSDLEGMVEVVSDGLDGFVFEQGNAAKLSEKIINALADTDNLKIISRAGIEKIKNNHDWGIIAKQTLELYQSIM